MEDHRPRAGPRGALHAAHGAWAGNAATSSTCCPCARGRSTIHAPRRCRRTLSYAGMGAAMSAEAEAAEVAAELASSFVDIIVTCRRGAPSRAYSSSIQLLKRERIELRHAAALLTAHAGNQNLKRGPVADLDFPDAAPTGARARRRLRVSPGQSTACMSFGQASRACAFLWRCARPAALLPEPGHAAPASTRAHILPSALLHQTRHAELCILPEPPMRNLRGAKPLPPPRAPPDRAPVAQAPSLAASTAKFVETSCHSSLTSCATHAGSRMGPRMASRGPAT